MKRITSAAVICLLMIVSYVAGRNHNRPDETDTNSRRVLYWVDPMHPDYKSDHPGNAPDCGMKLEPVYAEDASKASMAGSMAQVPSGAISIASPLQQLVGMRTATVEKSDARLPTNSRPESPIGWRSRTAAGC
jgi:Cu(I)/Ag(I) efflux system membrane fusion protein